MSIQPVFSKLERILITIGLTALFTSGAVTIYGAFRNNSKIVKAGIYGWLGSNGIIIAPNITSVIRENYEKYKK
jgi:hypothetical protein